MSHVTRGKFVSSESSEYIPLQKVFSENPPLCFWTDSCDSDVMPGTESFSNAIEQLYGIDRKDYYKVVHSDNDHDDHPHTIWYPKWEFFKIYISGLKTTCWRLNYIQIDLMIRLMHLTRKLFVALDRDEECVLSTPYVLPNGVDTS